MNGLTPDYLPEESELEKAWMLVRESISPDNSTATYKELYEGISKERGEAVAAVEKKCEEHFRSLKSELKDARSELDTADMQIGVLRGKLAAYLGVPITCI